MKITRRFTKQGQDVFASVKYEKRTSRISNPDGSVVFEMNDAEIPVSWSQLATDIMVSKYFRKAGVPLADENGQPLRDAAGNVVTGPEKSARQVINRLAGCWRHWGEKHGYFDSAEDAQAFYDELCYMLLHQMCAPNSPQWFNTGLNWAYGITGPAQGHYYCDPKTGELLKSRDAYSHPQPHACQPFFAPVSTPKGVIRIGKIVENNMVGLEVFDGTRDGRGTTRVVAVKYNGQKLVLRVQLASGTAVYATADHLVWCVPQGASAPVWRQVGDLRCGDRLVERLALKEPMTAASFVPMTQALASSGAATASQASATRDRADVLVLNQRVEVTDVSELGIERVYDIQTESGQYLSNNVTVHNCFIQSVSDDLVNAGGIMDLWTREARLFKYGSGTGSNFSHLRGEDEPLSGGGKSSGLMSFLKIGDRAAGAIKSGGTTRRAAKMVCLDLDHPDVEMFVNWKVREELKVAALAEGIKHLSKEQQETAKRLGLKLDYDFNGEAYYTVSGQNSNNSVRIPNSFFKALEEDGDWCLTRRTDGKVSKTVKARDLWDQIAYAAWRCADPGVQYDTTINEWHTCPKSGRINASNPCVTGDTRVLTPGGIWRRIDQMIHLPTRVVTNLDGQEIHVTDGSFPTGTQDVFELRTAGGYRLKLTADHKVWTRSRGWVEAKDLQSNDEVQLPGKPSCVHEVGEPQDARFFQLLGMFLSDANGQANALRLDACVSDADLRESFARYVADTWGALAAPADRRPAAPHRGHAGGYAGSYNGGAYGNAAYGGGYADPAYVDRAYTDDYVNRAMLDGPRPALQAEHDGHGGHGGLGGNGHGNANGNGHGNGRHHDDGHDDSHGESLGGHHAAASGASTLTATLSNRRLLNRLKAFVRTEPGTRRLGDEAFTAGLAAQKHMLRALFTADATVANGSLTLHSTNLPLLEDVQLILLGFGIQSALVPVTTPLADAADAANSPTPPTFQRNSEGGAFAGGGLPGRRAAQDVPGPRADGEDLPHGGLPVSGALPGTPGSRGDADLSRHGLRIDPGSLRSFGKYVGLLPGKKLEQLADAISFALARPEATANTDRVASLTPLGKKQVFDLTEPVTSSFVANGLTVHNCSEYMFLDDTACFGPETRISTPNGLRAVADLYAAQERGETIFVTTDLYSENDHRRLTAHRPAIVTKVGEREVFRMTLRDGRSIRATADHKFLTDEGEWKRLDELKVGEDRLEVRAGGNPVAFTSPKAEVERWQMLGWLTGDGVFSKDNVALVFGPQEQGTAKVMAERFNDLHCEAAGAPRGAGAKHQCHLSTQANGVLQITSKAESLVTFLQEKYGFHQGTAIYKDVPAAIHRVADDLKVAYLQGLFSADGCIRKAATEHEVMLASSAPELLRSVQLILSDLGIVSRITWCHVAGRKNPQGQLHLYNQQARKFLALVGFPCSQPKAEKAAEILSKPFEAEMKNPRPSTVVSIERDEVTTVYDVTEPVTHSVIAEGIIAHNCNLASFNVLTFFDAESRRFDIDGYRHAIRLWTIVLEVSVLMASFPSEEIARLSYKFRTLGLGYANLGAMLMQAGIAYDSDKGRAICAALTSILTGESYATSAEMAAELGAFPGYAENKSDMLRVIRNHRRAAYDASHNAAARRSLGAYEKLEIEPVGIDADQFADNDPMAPKAMLAAARECWDRALATGERNGYRNAQVTVIAPTGTIGLLMDCDTTGVEPDFALVKFKKLAGGGYFKIANQSLRPALENLGYEPEQIHDILKYVMGTLTLHGAPHLEYERLLRLGFTAEELEKIEAALPGTFEISFAFSPWSLGEAFFRRMEIAESEWQDPKFNLLRHLGFTRKQIDEANDVICGRGTVEGAPHLKDEHLPVFDCANKCGKVGKRFIPVTGHIKMMAAAQPFISGAISKTINLPNEATVEDIKQSYRMSWELGLKANALYRDGSKLSQPLNVKSDEDLDKAEEEDADAVAEAKEEVAADVARAAREVASAESATSATSATSGQGVPTGVGHSDNLAPLTPTHTHTIEKIVERIVERPLRRRLPDTRRAVTHKFDVAGHEGYITVGLYEDGQPGEVFIRIAKEGSTIGGLMDTIATLVSVSLQYGVPVESLVRKFEHVRFEPSGMTRNADIPMAKSLVDYIFRWMAMEFVHGYRAANAPQRAKKKEKNADAAPAPAAPADAADEATSPAMTTKLPTTSPTPSPKPANGGHKPGNGHGPRFDPDSAKPFEYASDPEKQVGLSDESLSQLHGSHNIAPEVGTPTSGPNLRLAIVSDPLSQQGSELQADAPACDVCGSITVRSGTCYKCLNCGNSMGCS